MIDPLIVSILAGVIGALLVLWLTKSLWSVMITVLVYICALFAISVSAGYPTNQSFPSEAIIYGLTNDYVWAAPKDNPYPPRSYIFVAPQSWHEERDRVKGQPFEVGEVTDKQDETGAQGSRGDRTSEGYYVIHRHILPPKED